VPLSTDAKNLMLAALKGTNPTTPITHVGIFQADAGRAVTGVASTDVLTTTSHGYSDGDVVLLSALTGGTGLVASRIYYVRDSTTHTYKLALVAGGTAVDFTADLSAGTVTRIVELTGGSPAYARKAIAFNTPVGGAMDDSTNGAVIDMPAGSRADYHTYHSASTAGMLLSVNLPPVGPETFVGQGTYTVTDVDFDLMSNA
jgi:hypothetical protein